MKEGSKYTKELQAEAIKMAVEQGLSLAEVGEELSIPKGTIAGWVAKVGRNGVATESSTAKAGDQSMAELKAELQSTRKQRAEARMVRGILKKATAYFAKESLPGTRS